MNFPEGTLGTETLPRLGMGAWAIGGPVTYKGDRIGWGEVDDRESLRALQEGFDAGLRLVDTADGYGAGHSERLIGKAIQGRRDGVLVATKFGHTFDEETRHLGDDCWDPAYIREACEGSLRRLGVDRIDLYQFHISSAVDAGAETRATLEQLVQEGKVRWFGWSTDRVESFVQFADSEDCVAVQQHFNVLWDEMSNLELLQLAERSSCASLVRGPLGHGLLTGKYSARSKPPADDFRSVWDLEDGAQAEKLRQLDQVREILQSGGRSLVQGALAWVWAMSPVAIPIPGVKTAEQVRELVGAIELGPLAAEDMIRIDGILNRNVYER